MSNLKAKKIKISQIVHIGVWTKFVLEFGPI